MFGHTQFYLRYPFLRNIRYLSKTPFLRNAQGIVTTPVKQTLLKKLSDNGDAGSQYKLAKMYQLGEEIPQDIEEAIGLYTDSADNGYVVAQRALGIMYYFGEKIDHKEAFKWFTKASNQGCLYSRSNLGAMFFFGDGVEPDHKRGITILRETSAFVDEPQRILELIRQEAEAIKRVLIVPFEEIDEALDDVIDHLNGEDIKYWRSMANFGNIGAQNHVYDLYASATDTLKYMDAPLNELCNWDMCDVMNK
jgi:hypothetical protein